MPRISQPVHHRLLGRMAGVGLIWAIGGVGAAMAQTAPAVRVDSDGSVHATEQSAPVSAFLSPEFRAMQIKRLTAPPMVKPGSFDVAAIRKASDTYAREITAGWQKIWPTTITPLVLNGVQTDDVVPVAGIAPGNRARVLINVHGGGFFLGARSGGWAEAVPVAGRGRIRVITVDYRLGPEHHFPAASEDVEQVYRALLKQYKPQDIGIYGCSAGGALVAQSLAWFQSKNLPRPGAAGIFCSGAMPGLWYGGDSFAFTPMLNGQQQVAKAPEPARLYLNGIDENNPLISPALFPKVLAQFPPTLMLTGTRDTAMSNVLVTHARLLAVGNDSQLLVQEGLGHGEFDTAYGTPEAAFALDVIWHFFDRHLGHAPMGKRP